MIPIKSLELLPDTRMVWQECRPVARIHLIDCITHLRSTQASDILQREQSLSCLRVPLTSKRSLTRDFDGVLRGRSQRGMTESCG
jgi:hypothetical protein